MNNEIWKDTPLAPGYQASSLGRIKNKNTNHIMKQMINDRGYCQTSLMIDKKKKTFKVHQLVAKTFLENEENLPYINHKDENKANNSLENLEWCSASYNINYGDRNDKVAKKVSIWRKKKGSDYSPRERKRVAQYTLDDKFVREFKSINEAGRETNSSIGTIRKCCVGISHTCNGYKWRFVLDKGE